MYFSRPGGGASVATPAAFGFRYSGVLAIDVAEGRERRRTSELRQTVVTMGRYRSGGFVPPAACCVSQLTLVGVCLMQATRWPGAFSSSGGMIFVHAASRAGC